MTREEAWNRIDAIIEKHEVDDVYVTINNHKDYDALRMAREFLEQEPCEDAVSRQYLIDIATKDGAYDYVSAQEIANAPPVNPQPKTGYWIDDNENEIDAQYGRHLYKCSECNEYADMFVGGAEDWWDIEKPNYCPNCGAKMIEPQERSDKE